MNVVVESLNQKMTTKVSTAATTVVATGGAATAPVQESFFPPYLTTHGIGVLSYAELFAVASFVWILICIIKAIWPFLKYLKHKFDFLRQKVLKWVRG